jgi:hypothetical protein
MLTLLTERCWRSAGRGVHCLALVVAVTLVATISASASALPQSGLPSLKVRNCGGGYPLGRPEVFNVRARGLTCLHAVAIVMTAYGRDLGENPNVGRFRCTFTSDGEAGGVLRCASGRKLVTADWGVF